MGVSVRVRQKELGVETWTGRVAQERCVLGGVSAWLARPPRCPDVLGYAERDEGPPEPRSASPGGRASKAKKKAPPAKGGKKKKKKKGSDDEAFEDSDDGDFEGQEVDYMSDGSR